MPRRFWFFTSLFLISSTLIHAADGKRLKILTSMAPLYAWASNVAGTHADVENLLPADVGPHDYQFRLRDVQRIKAADLIFINGLGLEPWLTRIIDNNDPAAARKAVELAVGIPTNSLIYELPVLPVEGKETHAHHHHGPANPHLWLDPVLARHGITNLLIALQQADPANASGYATNAAAYLSRLDALDAEIRAAVAQLSHHDVVTFHDAFPYFCRRYGLNLVGVIEEVPGTSPSPRYLAALSAVIRERKIKALFTEPQFDDRLARQLARDLGVKVAQLDTLETGRLTASGYEDGMRANLRVLLDALK